MSYPVCTCFRRYLCLLFFLSGYCVTAQERMDSGYVHRFSRQVTLRVYLGEKISIFSLDDNKHNKHLFYRPNNILALGIGTTIKGIGINFSTRLPFHGTKEHLYGRTRRYDLQAHRYRGKWAIDLYGQRYRGFHLNSSDDVDTVIGPYSYPYLPDLTTLTLGTSVMYVFNGDRFSMKGAVNQQDWQLRSAGSLMVGGAFFARYIFNNGSILPPGLKYPQFYEGSQPQHITNYGLTLKAGYAYNHVFKKHYFAGASLDAGAGPGYSLVRDVNGDKREGLGLVLTGNVRFAAGYNAPKWYGGLYFIFHTDQYSLPYENSKLWTSQGIFRIVVARRIFSNRLGAKG
jgi:hypothetical protein